MIAALSDSDRIEAIMVWRIAIAATAAVTVLSAMTTSASAAAIKVLTGGAYKAVLVAVAADFERRTGHKVEIDNDTVGALMRRIAGGETFDMIVVSPKAIADLTRQGKIAEGTRTDLAKVGVGVMVKAGAPKPDVSTVEAFRRAVLEARSIGYIDPASGGSSGIYVAKLLERLGLADQVKGKTRLKRGGHVSDLVASGEAELGIHQISEILPSKEVSLVGPLPAEIQNYTTYSAGISPKAANREVAEALIQALAGPAAAEIMASRGMVRP
jgi:molybdate transport system substrate-binding protein